MSKQRKAKIAFVQILARLMQVPDEKTQSLIAELCAADLKAFRVGCSVVNAGELPVLESYRHPSQDLFWHPANLGRDIIFAIRAIQPDGEGGRLAAMLLAELFAQLGGFNCENFIKNTVEVFHRHLAALEDPDAIKPGGLLWEPTRVLAVSPASTAAQMEAAQRDAIPN